MSAVPTRLKLPSADRRAAIVQAAAFIFAENGYAGATTSAIARRAGVSEALLYRYFVSKRAMYRAVLRDLIRSQNREVSPTSHQPESTAAFVDMMRDYLRDCFAMVADQERANGFRLLIASLIGDGLYARLIYRRALRLRLPLLVAALERATSEGYLTGTRLSPVNAFFLLNHVGSMLALHRMQKHRLLPAADEDQQLVEEALLFCMRGLGFPDALLNLAPPKEA